MFESDAGEEALIEAEASDITGATVTYAGADYPCTEIITGQGGLFILGGESPRADTMIVIRKSVLAAGIVFGTGNYLTVKRNKTGDSMDLKIKSDLGIRDLVFAWELTCDDKFNNA